MSPTTQTLSGDGTAIRRICAAPYADRALLPQVALLAYLRKRWLRWEVAHSPPGSPTGFETGEHFLCKTGGSALYQSARLLALPEHARQRTGQQSSCADGNTSVYVTPSKHAVIRRGRCALRSVSLGLASLKCSLGTPAFYRRHEAPMITIWRRVMQEGHPCTPSGCITKPLPSCALRKKPDERYPSLSEMLAAVLAHPEGSEQIEIPERTGAVCVGTDQTTSKFG